MKILGLSLGQLTTAALMVDGKIVACASEERFTRHKNDMEFPKNAIEYCLKEGGIKGSELDLVAHGAMEWPAEYQITKKFSHFSIADCIREQHEYWYPKLYEKKDVKWTEVFKDKINPNQYPFKGWDKLPYNSSESWKAYKEFIIRTESELLGIPKEKIVFLDHHTCHGYYGYFASPLSGKPAIILTMDAWGDDLNATVSRVVNGKVERVIAHGNCNLARIYRYITLLLGMMPNEHEYKVMGLAAYAHQKVMEKPYQVFKNTMYVKGTGFDYREKPQDNYFYFQKKLEGMRFDGIAGGLQKYAEDILTEWTSNVVKELKIHNVVFSGGVAMNIKAMQRLAELPEVHDLFVCGSGSDESLSIGACYAAYYEYLNKQGKPIEMKPLGNMYLGGSFSQEYVDEFVKNNKLKDKYNVAERVSNKEVAKKLSEGHVLARCVGRMEFGARALGNRSIVADPRNSRIVKKINEKIKNRDFWMPFAPSILYERVNDYIVNPKNLFAPYMSISFETKPLAREHLPAALHAADFSARPQMVKKEMNPEYHALISEFEKITGVGAVLNTSFNLHGRPIVHSPKDALYVFENSDLDMLLVERTLISKKE